VAHQWDVSDLRTVLTWFGPEWIIEAAKDYGTGGDPVFGAVMAFEEARRLARRYIHYIRLRDEVRVADLKLALLFRATGHSPGLREHKHVIPMPENDWRDTAMGWMWPDGPGLIPGGVPVITGSATQAEVNRATILAVSRMLHEHPEWNRAILDGRLWQRRTPEVMVHAGLKTERIRGMIFACHDRDMSWLKHRMTRAIRAILTTERHELLPGVTAAQIGVAMMRRWMGRFIASPAGAMISLAPKVPQGWAALVPNGVPLAFTVCEVGGVDARRTWITATVDHRAIDGDAAGKMYQFLRREVPRILANGR
jgi:hypothetical protein